MQPPPISVPSHAHVVLIVTQLV